jgi:hypothetical protein
MNWNVHKGTSVLKSKRRLEKALGKNCGVVITIGVEVFGQKTGSSWLD